MEKCFYFMLHHYLITLLGVAVLLVINCKHLCNLLGFVSQRMTKKTKMTLSLQSLSNCKEYVYVYVHYFLHIAPNCVFLQ